mmetsp:Transcript_9206/g.40266  ORF Transcript_9206/g.40266 Transcript_9206/m.40266 type:complete len:185 (-) Transcript_9206:456-1010(-)
MKRISRKKRRTRQAMLSILKRRSSPLTTKTMPAKIKLVMTLAKTIKCTVEIQMQHPRQELLSMRSRTQSHPLRTRGRPNLTLKPNRSIVPAPPCCLRNPGADMVSVQADSVHEANCGFHLPAHSSCFSRAYPILMLKQSKQKDVVEMVPEDFRARTLTSKHSLHARLPSPTNKIKLSLPSSHQL